MEYSAFCIVYLLHRKHAHARRHAMRTNIHPAILTQSLFPLIIILKCNDYYRPHGVIKDHFDRSFFCVGKRLFEMTRKETNYPSLLFHSRHGK